MREVADKHEARDACSVCLRLVRQEGREEAEEAVSKYFSEEGRVLGGTFLTYIPSLG